MSRTRFAATLLPLVLLAALSGCSAGSGHTASQTASGASSTAHSGASAPTPATAHVTPTITIKDFMYTVPATISAGSTITVINSDQVVHTLTLPGGSKVTVPGGATGHITAPSKPGSYPITCDFHGNMHATLTVS